MQATMNLDKALRDILREKMNDLADHIAGGACTDFAEYRHTCGIIQGLAIAERELLDLSKKIDDD